MDNLNPFFSIIIPSYNRAHSILGAVSSILNQSFKFFEIIVVDDASTDNTREIIATIHDERVFYLRNEDNLERCNSRNIGIRRAKGQYVCFLDSDDYHLPDHLKLIYDEIKRVGEPKAFFFTNAWNETSSGIRTERECPDFNLYDPFTYFLRYTVNPQRWAVHKSILVQNLFDPDIVICEDMDTSLRIAASKVQIHQIKVRSTVYVAAEDSFTVSDPRKAEKELYYLKKIFARVELKDYLPTKEKKRLLSMCYYHLSVKSFRNNQKWQTIRYSLKSVVLYPKGYNGNTLKPILVMIFYSIPIIGDCMKAFIRFVK